jgi:hypothetical protein
MGDYSGMGGGPGNAYVKVEKVKSKKKDKEVQAVAVEITKPPEEPVDSNPSPSPSDEAKPAEGTIFLPADIRRRQRSILGSLAREETKVGSLNVQEVRRLAHVTFDPEAQKFIGLPAEWEAAVNTNFGLPLALCRGCMVPGYQSRIPTILVAMGKYLLDRGGRNVKGIFRLAPDQLERDAVLQQLASGTFSECTDIHCISTGIKVWFRELPVAIFRDLDESRIKTCDTDTEAAAILARCPEPALSVLLWLMDLSAEIINNSLVNMMTSKNMSIVITPNLYRVKEGGDPQEMLFLAKKFTDFFERCLNNRIRDKEAKVDAEDEPKFSQQGSVTFTIDLDDASINMAPTPKRMPDTVSADSSLSTKNSNSPSSFDF